MDFPVILEHCEFVDEHDQIRQSIASLLQNTVGSFIQDPSLGSLFDVHDFDYALIHSGVIQSLQVLPIEVLSVDVKPPLDSDDNATCRIDVSYSYNNQWSVFKNYN